MIGVYGAGGFMGRHLLKRLAERDLPARAVSRKFDASFDRGSYSSVEFVEADFRQSLAMAASLQDVDTVVQLVSSSSPGLKNDHVLADIQENVVPHVAFLHACMQAGVRRYIFLSSGGTVYGPGAPIPTPETCPTNPINSHGLTKLMVEKYIQMYGQIEGLDFVILRVANSFGPGQKFRKGQGLIPAILDRWHKGEPIRILGDGNATRDYIYIDDVIDAIEAALTVAGAPKLVVNIGSGEPRSIMAVIEAIEAATDHRFEKQFSAARITDVDVACLDITQAKNLLSWIPMTPFAEGIRRTVAQIGLPPPRIG